MGLLTWQLLAYKVTHVVAVLLSPSRLAVPRCTAASQLLPLLTTGGVFKCQELMGVV